MPDAHENTAFSLDRSSASSIRTSAVEFSMPANTSRFKIRNKYRKHYIKKGWRIVENQEVKISFFKKKWEAETGKS